LTSKERDEKKRYPWTVKCLPASTNRFSRLPSPLVVTSSSLVEHWGEVLEPFPLITQQSLDMRFWMNGRERWIGQQREEVMSISNADRT
jgi:hypothetical protein